MFFDDIIPEIKLILQGNLNFGHYLTFGLGLISIIVGLNSLKRRVYKGISIIIASLYYILSFCITFNNYATSQSATIFSITAIVLNFIIWLTVSRINIRHCFTGLWAYLLTLVPLVIGAIISESDSFNLSDTVILQFSVLFTAAILSFSVPMIEGMPSGGSSSDPFDKYGPGWKEVLDWRH